jgi:hypothetical protein
MFSFVVLKFSHQNKKKMKQHLKYYKMKCEKKITIFCFHLLNK